MAKFKVGTKVRNNQTLLTGIIDGHYELGGKHQYNVTIDDGQKMDGRKLDGQTSIWEEGRIGIIGVDDTSVIEPTTEDTTVIVEKTLDEIGFMEDYKGAVKINDHKERMLDVIGAAHDEIRDIDYVIVEVDGQPENVATYNVKDVFTAEHVVEMERFPIGSKVESKIQSMNGVVVGYYVFMKDIQLRVDNGLGVGSWSIDDKVVIADETSTEDVVEPTTEDVVEPTTEDVVEPTTTQVDVEQVAKVVLTERWKTLKATPETMAVVAGCTTEQVNNVIEREQYLDVIREMFNNRKSWQTWAKKGSKIVAKRLYITEEQATTIIEGINQ